MQNLIGRTLRLTTGICARLMACADPAAAPFLRRAHNLIEPPALLPARPSLTPPGAESARLEGHTDWVAALAVLPGGRLASPLSGFGRAPPSPSVPSTLAVRQQHNLAQHSTLSQHLMRASRFFERQSLCDQRFDLALLEKVEQH